MEVDIFWKVQWTVALLVDSCSCPGWWLGYVMNIDFMWKAPPFPEIHSGGAEHELGTTQRRGESSLFPLVSECSGLGKCLFEHKVPVKFLPTKM